ncbi:MAG: FecR family protein [Agriterribacter sp.]
MPSIIMADPRLSYLFNKVIEKTASSEEKEELQALLLDPENENAFKALVEEAFVQVRQEVKMNDNSAAEILEVIGSMDHAANEAKVVAMKTRKRKWAAVAAAAIIIVAAAWFLKLQIPVEKKSFSYTDNEKHNVAAPARSQAVLTLSSGKTILLDSLAEGDVVTDGAVKMAKGGDGRIVYTGLDQKEAFNTIALPRGSRPLQLVLSDGTVTWLNAASAITYPTNFTGQERQVKIEGEAYFEVAHDKNKPFIVQTGVSRVQVLGTHFNVKAYADESSTDVTLIEGSVRVERAGQENAAVLLQPGQQALVGESIQLVKEADLKAAVAWKNGYFSLKGADLYSIMRQVARWYDVEVFYEGTFSDQKFVGALSRDISLNDLLKSLEEYGIEGRLENRQLTLHMKNK